MVGKILSFRKSGFSISWSWQIAHNGKNNGKRREKLKLKCLWIQNQTTPPVSLSAACSYCHFIIGETLIKTFLRCHLKRWIFKLIKKIIRLNFVAIYFCFIFHKGCGGSFFSHLITGVSPEDAKVNHSL